MQASKEPAEAQDPRVQEAGELHGRLCLLRASLAAAREARDAVGLREGLLQAEAERFWDPEVVQAEMLLGQLLREARAALGHREVQQMQQLLEGGSS